MMPKTILLKCIGSNFSLNVDNLLYNIHPSAIILKPLTDDVNKTVTVTPFQQREIHYRPLYQSQRLFQLYSFRV